MTDTPGRRVDTAVQAVTFDFWNTLMWEEPGSLKQNRLKFWAEALDEVGARVDPVALEHAHDAAHDRYVDSWTLGRQFRIEEAVKHMLEQLDSAVSESIKDALAEGFREAGLRAAVHPSVGIRECLEVFRRADVRVGIVCDIGLTPSMVVRKLLERVDLSAFFDDMTFSDEVGQYKPARAIFERALARLGAVAPEHAAHVGDRRRTDVGGAISMGMTAVRYNGVYEDETIDAPEADVVVADLTELPRLLGVDGTGS